MTARVGIAVVAMLALVAPVRAEPTVDSTEVVAKQHFSRGKQLAAAKDFSHAYDEFAAGYVVSHRAPFLFNMAECMRVLGDAPRARDLYTRYLAASPDGELAAAARARVTELGGLAPEPAPPPAAPVIPPPPDVAAQVVAAQPAPPVIVRESSPPLWHRTPFWIGVGLAVAGAAVGAYFLTHHQTSCAPPGCVELP
ncbi:MAG TPA: hypothetical protein VGL61_06155 [Kofleriaceae bacterium]